MAKHDGQKELNKGLRLLAKSSVVVFVALFLSKIFTYLYRIIIARYFGPEIYGLFTLAVMVVGVFIAASSFGLTQGLLRFVSQYRGNKETNKIKRVLKYVKNFLLISGLVAAVLLFTLSEVISLNFFHNADLIIFLKIFAFLIPIYVFSDIFLLTIRAYEKISWYAFINNILQNFIKLVALVLFIFIGLGTNAVIFSYFIGILAMLITAYLYSRYKLPEIFGKYVLEIKEEKQIKKNLFNYSWPIMFSALIMSVFIWIDSFSIGYFHDAVQVGFYNAAIPIVILLSFVPDIFIQLFFPLINKEYSQKNFETIKELGKQVGKWILILNLPIFLLMFLFPGVIITILFGEEYLVAETALRILSVGAFISSLAPILENLILMVGKSKVLLINMVVVSIINIVLNIILVPKYGINGAAVSTMAVWILLTSVLLVESHYFTQVLPLRRKSVQILLISLVPALLLVYLKSLFPQGVVSFLLLGIFFVLIYLFLIIITGCLDKNDILVIKSFKTKILGK